MINEQVVAEFLVGEEFGGERLLSAAHFGDEGPDSGGISDCDETFKTDNWCNKEEWPQPHLEL